MKVNLKMSPAIATSVTFTDEEEIDKPRLGINYEGNKLYTPIGLGWDKKGLYSRIYNGSFKALWGSVSKRDDPVLENPVRSVTTAWNAETKQMHLSFDDELLELLDTSRTSSMYVEYVLPQNYDTMPANTNNMTKSFQITGNEVTIDFSGVIEGSVLLAGYLYTYLRGINNNFKVFFFFGGSRETDKKCTSQVNVFDFYNTPNESLWSVPTGVTYVYNNGSLKITSLGNRRDQYLTFQYDDLRFVYVDPYTEDTAVLGLNEEHEVNAYNADSGGTVKRLGLRNSVCWFTLLHKTDGEWLVMPPNVQTQAPTTAGSQLIWTQICMNGPLNAYSIPVEMAQKVKAQTGINLIRDE